ncbi:MAG TPA: PQQ-binding-like beta-propeller repeat protein [Thermomicrobiaceae bacterium]|nr:PQQ-binding-like beta-propeller repeat protein [Thermomicrobiaceae bacterium]
MQRSAVTTLRAWLGVVLVLAMAAVGTGILPPATAASGSDWPMFGQNLNNTASASTNIGTGNVKHLKLKWAFNTGGDVSARAAVVGNVAYFPDWSGHLYAVKASNGKLIWSRNIAADYFNGSLGATVVSRTSPFVDAATGTLYIGTQTGARLLAINTADGSLRWATQLDAHPWAVDTGSPVVHNGVLYVGVSSLEEAAAADPSYPCCSFRGSVVALNASTGQILWKTYTVPEGYTGGSVWGSTLVPDPQLGVIFATTGNNYTTPAAVQDCIAAGSPESDCLSPDDFVDSVVSLSMATGQVQWATRLASADDWNVACFYPGNPNCPEPAGPDFDFGSGANLITYQTAQGSRTILGAGQKSGVYWALDPTTGQVLWGTQVGPGSALGGIQWGSASDGQRIYVAVGNLYGVPYTLPSGQTSHAGSWAALDPADGHVIWQVADPNGAMDLGPMTVANGVVYAPSMGAQSAGTPNMFALNAATGKTLWSYASGGSVVAGAVVANDAVYWGSGYANLAVFGGVGSHTFYAFSTGGH